LEDDFRKENLKIGLTLSSHVGGRSYQFSSRALSYQKSAKSERNYAQEARKMMRKVEIYYPLEEKGLGVLCG
jgi:hypothetical protein